MSDLFSNTRPEIEEVYPDVYLLAHFAETRQLIQAVEKVTTVSPFRKMMTPNGHQTNIPFSNCGQLGWTSDINGYRYSKTDPLTNTRWPSLPAVFSTVANKAAYLAGFKGFKPDACLINQYKIGSRLNAHQDKNERDFRWPIVSISAGLPAVFQIFGEHRDGKATNIRLYDGDVMVWGGRSRLIYHGVRTITPDHQFPQSNQRINITLRKAT